MPLSFALFSVTNAGRTLFQHQEPLTFDQPIGTLPVVDDARWSAAFTGNSWGALIVWILLLVLPQYAGWPIVRRMFTRLPDRGWAFSRLVTLLVAGYAVWFLASVQLIAFRAMWSWVAILLVALASLTVGRRIPLQDGESPMRRNPIAVTAEVVFWSVFGLFLLYRLVNPDSYHPFWGGEKPMEFAHLNAILRSAHFPPVDPWYSGGFINYYYYGTYLVAFLIKLTGIPVELAFNLAQPTFPALLASASFSLTAALAKRVTGSMLGAWISGLVGMLFVQFAGNMIVPTRLLDRAFNDRVRVDGWGFWFWGPSRALPSPETGYNITEFPYFGALYADLHPHVIAMPFTILVVALAWQLASVWRALSKMVARRSASAREFLSVILPALIAALALGSLFMINAWDLPLFAIVVAASVVMMTVGLRRPWQRAAIAAAIIGAVALLSLIITVPFNLHYVALFSEIDTVIEETPLLGIQSHLGGQLLLMTLGIAAMMVPRSLLSRSAKFASGVVLPLLIAVALFIQWRANGAGSESLQLAEYALVTVIVTVWAFSAWASTGTASGTRFPIIHARIRAVDIMIVTVVLLALDRPVLALYAGIGLSAAVMWTCLQRPSERFLMMLIAGATLLGASLELVYLVDDLQGSNWYRMNTIFKFYNQVWNLLGVSTGVLAGRAVWDAIVHTGETEPDDDHSRSVREPGLSWNLLSVAMTVVVAFASLSYAVVATPVRLDTRFAGGSGLTLNAYAWMEYGEIPLFRIENEQRVPIEPLRYADDLDAINWLNENVHGTPVIAEAAFGTYRCNGSRFSITTGLPAVIGWQRHQQQQRYLDDLAARENSLREMYTNPDTTRQLEILDRYNVEYVVIGQTERHYPTIQGNDCIDTGSPEAIASLEGLVGDRLEIAYESGSTTVYRVIPE